MDNEVAVALVAATASLVGAATTLLGTLIASRRAQQANADAERRKFAFEQQMRSMSLEADRLQSLAERAEADRVQRQSHLEQAVQQLQRAKDSLYRACGTTRIEERAYSSAGAAEDVDEAAQTLVDLYRSLAVRLIPFEVAMLHDLKNAFIDAAESVRSANEGRASAQDAFVPRPLLDEVDSVQEYFRVQIQEARNG